jgi:hypothetical protein
LQRKIAKMMEECLLDSFPVAAICGTAGIGFSIKAKIANPFKNL